MERQRSWTDDPASEAARAQYRDTAKIEAKPNGHAATAGPRFRFTPFHEIKLGTAPAYAVHGLIPRLGVTVIWGKPKCGKTFSAFDIEMHVALGWPYRGRRVRQGTVLHIACEGVAGLAARKEAWRLHHYLHGRVDKPLREDPDTRK